LQPTRKVDVPAEAEATPRSPSTLSARDVEVLAFEALEWAHPGVKEEAVRVRFGLSFARYYQMLSALIDQPDAVRHDPVLVYRLQRERDSRTHARAARSLTVPLAAGL